MIVGVGVDLVDTVRFDEQLRRTPKLLERLFRPEERELKVRSLAARFAAKEAFVKALGNSKGFGFQDLLISGGGDEQPRLVLLAGALEAANARGVSSIHLSISHDGVHAMAFVVIEGEMPLQNAQEIQNG
ncbi:MAG: holo-ACP synthase [Microbacteriaceae bacterium]